MIWHGSLSLVTSIPEFLTAIRERVETYNPRNGLADRLKERRAKILSLRKKREKLMKSCDSVVVENNDSNHIHNASNLNSPLASHDPNIIGNPEVSQAPHNNLDTQDDANINLDSSINDPNAVDSSLSSDESSSSESSSEDEDSTACSVKKAKPRGVFKASSLIDYHNDLNEAEMPGSCRSLPFLEALNVALDCFEHHQIDRQLTFTGQAVFVLSANHGVIYSDRALCELTKRRFNNSGVRAFLICFKEKPLHRVPLLLVAKEPSGRTSSENHQGSNSNASAEPLNSPQLGVHQILVNDEKSMNIMMNANFPPMPMKENEVVDPDRLTTSLSNHTFGSGDRYYAKCREKNLPKNRNLYHFQGGKEEWTGFQDAQFHECFEEIEPTFFTAVYFPEIEVFVKNALLQRFSSLNEMGSLAGGMIENPTGLKFSLLHSAGSSGYDNSLISSASAVGLQDDLCMATGYCDPCDSNVRKKRKIAAREILGLSDFGGGGAKFYVESVDDWTPKNLMVFPSVPNDVENLAKNQGSLSLDNTGNNINNNINNMNLNMNDNQFQMVLSPTAMSIRTSMSPTNIQNAHSNSNTSSGGGGG